ncbi:MAG: DUF2141 domain-containing protein [Flavobacteriaceae bacterium]|nr:DUF2141 domain-containing protein [Flavobacteriaceae bacterium]
MKKNTIVVLRIVLLFMSYNLIIAQNTSSKGILTVKINNIKTKNGKIIVKLFKKGDAIFGTPFLQLTAGITNDVAEVKFEDLSFANYVVFAFHDKNNNAIVDHNLLGFPTEPMGFSNHWNFNLLSGMPTYKKTNFLFSKENNSISIKVK